MTTRRDLVNSLGFSVAIEELIKEKEEKNTARLLAEAGTTVTTDEFSYETLLDARREANDAGFEPETAILDSSMVNSMIDHNSWVTAAEPESDYETTPTLNKNNPSLTASELTVDGIDIYESTALDGCGVVIGDGAVRPTPPAFDREFVVVYPNGVIGIETDDDTVCRVCDGSIPDEYGKFDPDAPVYGPKEGQVCHKQCEDELFEEVRCSL